ncbi:MAG: GNAT family N-acetyltransferase, partial [Fibrobacteres bacterium]|nr:GNAT family N-acetyltransferase [Fibrobacterota bacterium]
TDLLRAARLVRDVSSRYFHPDIQTEEGKKYWKNLQSVRKENIANQKKLFDSIPIKIVATHNSMIIGIVTGTDNELLMIFVRPSFHKKGIATQLFTRYKNLVIKNGSNYIKVKSSRYAERFYQKVGFVRTGDEKLIYGLPAIPMAMTL